MKKIWLLSVLAISGCSTSSAYLDIQGAAWRKTEAFSATQFAVGVIETSGRNRFDPRGFIKIDDLPMIAQTTYFSKETATAALEAKAKAKGAAADVGGDLNYKIANMQSSKYVIFRTLDPFTLVDRMNAAENLPTLRRLKQLKNPVIVTGTAVAFDNDLSKKVEVGVKANATVTSISGAPEFTLGGNHVSEVNGKFSDGTVFAYEYSSIEWDADPSVPKIKSITIDRPMNPWF